MVKAKVLFLSLASAAILVACGGGGEEKQTSSSDGGMGNPVAISSSNYQQVATSSYGASNTTSTFASSVLAGGSTVVGAQITEMQSVKIGNIAKDISKNVIRNWGSFSSPVTTGVVTTISGIACSNGGTISGVKNDNDNNGSPSAGDFVSVTLTNCNDGDYTLNGGMTLEIVNYSGDPFNSVGAISITISFTDLTANGNESINGSLTLALSATSSTNGSFSISTPNLEYINQSTLKRDKLTAFVFAFNASSNSASFSISGNTYSSDIGGYVSITTPVEFTINSLGAISGYIVMEGANGSKARIVGLGNSSTIRIDGDANGDGTFELTNTISTATLGL